MSLEDKTKLQERTCTGLNWKQDSDLTLSGNQYREEEYKTLRGAADNDFKLILPFPAWPLYWKHGKGYFPLFPFFCEICNRIREKCWKVCRKRGGEAELVKCLSQHISEVKRRKS